MAKLQHGTLSNRMVARLKVAKDTVYWDRELTGFGVRVYPTGSKVYIVQARGPKGPSRLTVGKHGVINVDEARKRAASIIARMKAGDETASGPVRTGEVGRRPHGGRTRETLHEGTRGDTLKAEFHEYGTLGGLQTYRVGLGPPAACVG